MTRYLVELTPVGGSPWQGVPPDERLRRLLKAMLRSYGMRCTSVRPVGRTEVVFRAVEDGEPIKAPAGAEPMNGSTYGRAPKGGT